MKKKRGRTKNVVSKDLVTSGLYRPKTFVDRKKVDKDSPRKEDFED